jgi:hypothetical protein
MVEYEKMNINSTFFKYLTQIQKIGTAAREGVDLHDFVSANINRITVDNFPYPHIVVDNFFHHGVYEGLCGLFKETRKKGLSESRENVPGLFHRFDMDYDGYVYTPAATLNSEDPLSLFFSIEWNLFFSRLFSISTGTETALALHHHPAGNKTGFVHHDNVDKYFFRKNTLTNGVRPNAFDAKHENMSTARRAIVWMVYLENPAWKEGDGGETGIYSTDRKTIIKKIAPINNRLFAFRIGPHSNHAFQANLSERNSLIQWFHIPREWLP